MTGTITPRTALLEIACFDAESAVTAWTAGADRIELCYGRDAGGITPSLRTVTHVKEHVKIPVYAMIRPRGGDFVYSSKEFDQMRADINIFKPLVDGFVLGILEPNGNVDVKRTAELVRLAAPLPCTFHRAFDDANDPHEALEDIIRADCVAILSSGGKPDAKAGMATLATLVRQAGERINILPGGGVRAKNIRELRETTRAGVFHSSGIPPGQSKANADEIRCMKALLLEAAPAGGMATPQSTQGSSDEETMPAAMLMSAVSIGPNAPAGSFVSSGR